MFHTNTHIHTINFLMECGSVCEKWKVGYLHLFLLNLLNAFWWWLSASVHEAKLNVRGNRGCKVHFKCLELLPQKLLQFLPGVASYGNNLRQIRIISYTPILSSSPCVQRSSAGLHKVPLTYRFFFFFLHAIFGQILNYVVLGPATFVNAMVKLHKFKMYWQFVWRLCFCFSAKSIQMQPQTFLMGLLGQVPSTSQARANDTERRSER